MPDAHRIRFSLRWLVSVNLDFSVDVRDYHYNLYKDCLEHLRQELCPSSPTSKADNQSRDQVRQRPLAQWPPPFSILVNCIADRYSLRTGDDPRSRRPCVVKNDNFLDYLIVGVAFVDRICEMSPDAVDTHPLSKFIDKELKHLMSGWTLEASFEPIHSFMNQSSFLDLFSSLWRSECAYRAVTLWSPMPWSQSSSSKQETFFIEFERPQVTDILLEATDAITAECRDALLARFGVPVDIPNLGLDCSHDGYPFCPTLFDYVKVRRAGRSPSARDDAALWLDALTFGVLEAILGMKIPESLLLRTVDGQQYLSGTHLFELLSGWHRSAILVQYALEPNRGCQVNVDKGREVADILKEALLCIDEECVRDLTLFTRAGFSRETRQDVMSALALMIVGLAHYAVTVWGDVIEEVADLPAEVRRTTRPFLVTVTEGCLKSLLKKGWCPNILQDEFVAVIGAPIMSHLLRLRPFVRTSIDEHRTCTRESCTIYNIVDTSTYEAKHLPSCSCPPAGRRSLLAPPPGDVESILAQGLIPVVVYVDGQLIVRSSTDIPYVAISHVWADGLGSTTEKGLPVCQISRLARLAQELLPESGAFWMDSLCVPEETHLRKQAIKRMARTYQEAAKVLVIDACIRSQCSRRVPWHDNIIRIATSGWVRRVWTLQEGILARELYFEFADGTVSSEDLESFGPCDDTHYVSILPLLAHRYRSRKYGPRMCTLDDVIMLLHLRTTSKPEDETVAISSLLPDVKLGTLLDITGEDAAEQRMASFLLQIKEFSRRLPLLSGLKLHIPKMTWAPRTVSERLEVARGRYGTGVCTEDGFLAEYSVARFPEPVRIPAAYSDLSKGVPTRSPWTARLVFGPTRSAYKAVLHTNRHGPRATRPAMFNALLFIEEMFPSDPQMIPCAAVYQRGSTEVAGRGQAVVAGRMECEYVAPGHIILLGASGSKTEEKVDAGGLEVMFVEELVRRQVLLI